MPTKDELKELQALPLERKILITQTRIMEWYFKFKGQVYVSFSGGKDSTVCLRYGWLVETHERGFRYGPLY